MPVSCTDRREQYDVLYWYIFCFIVQRILFRSTVNLYSGMFVVCMMKAILLFFKEG